MTSEGYSIKIFGFKFVVKTVSVKIRSPHLVYMTIYVGFSIKEIFHCFGRERQVPPIYKCLTFDRQHDNISKHLRSTSLSSTYNEILMFLHRKTFDNSIMRKKKFYRPEPS